MSRRAWYSSSLRGVARVASTPSSPAGAPGEDQGVSWMAVAAKISSRRLGDPGRAGWAPAMAGEDPGKGPGEPGRPGAARSSPGRARCARSSAEGPREGPGVARMPVAAKTSSKRLGVPARAGCCAATTEARVEGPGVSGVPVAARSSSRKLGGLGGQGPPLRRQRPPGRAPACPGRPWPPRAHLGGSSSSEGWGAGAVALAEGPCLHRRVTPATAGCVSPAVEAAGWPLAQAARGP